MDTGDFVSLSPSSSSSILPFQTQNQNTSPTSNQKLQFLLQSQPQYPWAYAIFWETFNHDDGHRLALTWADAYFLQYPDKPITKEIQSLLRPENDDTDHWFYVVSLTKTFLLGDGSSPAKAMATNSVIWLSGSHNLHSVDCRRTKEAHANGLETLVYLPTTNGVVEIGSYHLIDNTDHTDLAKLAKSLFGIGSSSSSSSPETILKQPNTTTHEHMISFTDMVGSMPPEDESINITDFMTDVLQQTQHQPAAKKFVPKNLKQLCISRCSNSSSEHSDSDSDCQEVLAITKNKGPVKKKGREPATLISHVEAERQRREKLNQRFYSLRSVVPNVSRMDKASLLADAVCYINELKNKVEELESQLQASAGVQLANNNQRKSKKVKVEAISDFDSCNVVSRSKATKICNNKQKTGSSVRNKLMGEVNVEVKMVGEDAMIRVESGNEHWPTAKLMDALREMEAIVHHASMSCVNNHNMLQNVVTRIPNNVTEDEVKYLLLTRLNN